jgi:hypothetical protein
MPSEVSLGSGDGFQKFEMSKERPLLLYKHDTREPPFLGDSRSIRRSRPTRSA